MTAVAVDDGQQAAARRTRLVGIALMCAALMCFASLDTTAKYLTRDLPTAQIVWARYFANVVIVSIFLNPIARPGVMRSSRPWLQIVRSMLLLMSTAMNFIAVRYLQLAETMSINFMMPLLVALIAVPLLGEKLEMRRLAAVIVGFAGILVITRPGFGTVHPAVFVTMAGCVAYAFYAITTRMLAAHDSAETTLFYSGLAGVLLLAPVLPWVWETPTHWSTWLLMGTMGVYAALGHYLLILAHQRAPAAVLAPFVYTQLLWMVGLGWLVFRDIPDRFTVIGGLIVAGSGLYLLSLERRKTA